MDHSNHINHHMNFPKSQRRHDHLFSEWDGYDYFNEQVWPVTILCFTRTPSNVLWHCDFLMKHLEWTLICESNSWNQHDVFFWKKCVQEISCFVRHSALDSSQTRGNVCLESIHYSVKLEDSRCSDVFRFHDDNNSSNDCHCYCFDILILYTDAVYLACHLSHLFYFWFWYAVNY